MKHVYVTATVVAIALFAFSPARAGGSVQSATIVEIAVNRAQGSVAFIKLSAPAIDGAACSVLGSAWTFTLSLDGVVGREMYAMLLSAVAGGKQIRAAGTGQCSEHGQIESLMTIHILG